MFRSRFEFATAAFIGLASAMIVASSAQAEIIAGWDVSVYTASGTDWHPSPLAPSTSDANVTVVGLTRNWTLGSGTAAAYAWGGNNFARTIPRPVRFRRAIT